MFVNYPEFHMIVGRKVFLVCYNVIPLFRALGTFSNTIHEVSLLLVLDQQYHNIAYDVKTAMLFCCSVSYSTVLMA